jgi:serine/threonine-protein kinase
MGETVAMGPGRGEADAFATEALGRGSALGRYELLVPVAVGGMARVWAARLHGQRGFTKIVAIKTVLPHLASDPEFERMLIDEARIASGARHPNVVEIYELGEERGIVYIAMEWVYGDSLANVLRAKGNPEPLDPRIAARMIADAAAGLHAAHNLADESGKALEVVHRDVSPHNLLVSLDGHVKVTDFGVAKAIGATHDATAAGQLKGKISYMAPEQASGAGVDRRSDVFSLGCVLYEATTGKQPFRGEGEHQVMQELLKGAFAAPSRLVRGYPFELERIVVRALASQPLHRYQTMDQMRVALEEWLAKGGSVVTQSNVAQVVRERIGAEVEKRREKIRAASAVLGEGATPPPGKSSRPPPVQGDGTPSGVKPARQSVDEEVESAVRSASRSMRASYTAMGQVPPGGAFPPVMELAPRAPSIVQYSIAASLGVLAAAALGVGGFWVWKSMQPPPAPVVFVTPVETEPAPLPPTPPATGTTAAAVATPVTFRVVPDKAVLVVDGTTLPASTRSVARPAAGKPVKVVVRAEGYEDQTLTIDDAAPASVDVWLTETHGAASPPRKPPSGAPHAGSPPPASAPTEALPANPY